MPYICVFLFAIFRDPFLVVSFFILFDFWMHVSGFVSENVDQEAIVTDERMLDLWLKSCS